MHSDSDVITPALAGARADQRHGLGQAMAALHPSDGGGTDRSRVDAACSDALLGPTMATASGGVRGGKGQESCNATDEVYLKPAVERSKRGAESPSRGLMTV